MKIRTAERVKTLFFLQKGESIIDVTALLQYCHQSSSIKHDKSHCIYDVKLDSEGGPDFWQTKVTEQFYFEKCFRIPCSLSRLFQKLLKYNFRL